MRRGRLGNVTLDENIVRNLSQSNPDLFLEVVTKDTTSLVVLRLFLPQCKIPYDDKHIHKFLTHM